MTMYQLVKKKDIDNCNGELKLCALAERLMRERDVMRQIAAQEKVERTDNPYDFCLERVDYHAKAILSKPETSEKNSLKGE